MVSTDATSPTTEDHHHPRRHHHPSSSRGGRAMKGEQEGEQGDGSGLYYRRDGVRITHDPYAPGMAEKYGLPGRTDPEGFDPYADTVGPGIYGGGVKRDPTRENEIIVGGQYQNHNHRPGPVYDGTGYSFMSRAIHAGPDTVRRVLDDFPELRDEVSTGGARPLHVCGMSRSGQRSTSVLVEYGASLRVTDTYGYTALHRMASNNLAEGGEVLVRAGMDPNESIPEADLTPIEIAKRSRAIDFLRRMRDLGHYP